MIDPDMINVWCWDARPFPDFPARDVVWSDGENWQRGHWLTGRMGLLPLADVVFDICRQSGLDFVDTSQLNGLVQGYHLDHAMTGRAALTPLSALYGFSLIETASGLRFVSEGTAKNIELLDDDIEGNGPSALSLIKSDPEERLKDARIHFIDASNDYQLGLTSARDQAAETVRIIDINAPIVMDPSFARYAADQILTRTLQSDRTIAFTLAGHRLDVEVGDTITLPNMDGVWQVQSLEGLTTQRVSAEIISSSQSLPLIGASPQLRQEPQWATKPVIFALDLPGPQEGLLVGAAQSPFLPTTIKGPESEVEVTLPVYMGALLTDMKTGPVGRWDYGTVIDIFLPGVNLSSLAQDDVFSRRNVFAVETPKGWEVFKAANAQLVAPNTYRLSKLLRGLDGSSVVTMDIIPAGARVTLLDIGWATLPVPESYIGERINLTAQAAGREGEDLEIEYKANYLRPLAPVHIKINRIDTDIIISWICLLYTSPSPRDRQKSRMPSSA